MTDQTGDLSTGFLEPLDDVMGQAERLEKTIANLMSVLKARGLMFSDTPMQDMQALRGKLDTTRQGGQKAAGKLQQLQKLVDTSALLTSSLELDRVLEQVMDAVIVLTRAQRAYLMLRDTASGELTIRAARNWDGANIDKAESSFSRGIINMALEQKQPILTSNALLDNRFQQMESIAVHTLRSIVCIPFMWHGQVIGVLYADNRAQEGIFNADMIPIVTAFANQATIAIENSRLFEQVKSDLLKAQHEVQTLRIQIDRQQADSQIDEIVSSEVFKRLAERKNPPTDQ
jgi:GAF domain-containing protein